MEQSTTSLPANITAGVGNQIQDNFSCFPESNDMKFTFIPVYITITSVLGILLNVFVLMVFCLHKKSCTTAEIYLSNMAAADLILVSFLPFRTFYIVKMNNWTFGLASCKVLYMSKLINVFCSIYFLVLVSIDRYLAVVHPTSGVGIRRPAIAKLGCVLVWILGFIFCLPALLYVKLYIRTICALNYPTISTYRTSKVSMSVFGFFIPVFIISLFTIKMIKNLKNEKKEGVNTERTDHEETTLVLAVLLVFSIFWFPCQLMQTISLLSEGNILTGCFFLFNLKSYSQIFCHFAFLKSILNPIVYIILGENFQKKVAELFRLKRNPDNPSTMRLSGRVQSEDDE